jgi:hypothetical protein
VGTARDHPEITLRRHVPNAFIDGGQSDALPRVTCPETNSSMFLKRRNEMKFRAIIIGLFVISVLAISVSAQKLTIQKIVLQDDTSGDHLIFVIPTGEYKFEACKESLSFSGIGSISIDGCKVTLKDVSENRRVLAEVDLCSRAGKADIAVEGPVLSSKDASVEVTLSDMNTGDSVFECTLKQIDPK